MDSKCVQVVVNWNNKKREQIHDENMCPLEWKLETVQQMIEWNYKYVCISPTCITWKNVSSNTTAWLKCKIIVVYNHGLCVY